MAKMMELLVVMTVFLSAVSNVDATSYTVGDSSGWNTPSNGDSTYTAWANQHQFVTGDILVFNFNTGLHTVATVNNKNDYDSCNAANANIQNNSPASIPLNSTGVHYFFCTVHCSQGQKLTVNVGSTNNNNGSPPPPPGTSPSPGSNNSSPPPPPPPPSAATSATFFSGLIILPVLLAVL
ncbi:PREDICTED: cucumber peeling cupredoxin-like [Ipomoea nil]|uniref:cucumber peeling cupredoxin-like n=1 Tax=Ipomoea nil TaxID=35883 RepID=UPI000900ACBF|nr:PREDICTED: cucumber peeling cupredoxin-like [Ipomoea nil]